jgi:hypothetical protein
MEYRGRGKTPDSVQVPRDPVTWFPWIYGKRKDLLPGASERFLVFQDADFVESIVTGPQIGRVFTGVDMDYRQARNQPGMTGESTSHEKLDIPCGKPTACNRKSPFYS